MPFSLEKTQKQMFAINASPTYPPPFLRPHYDIRVSIGSTLLILQPLKIIVYAPSGASVPEGASFDVRKVIGSSPISSTKPLVKTSGFFFCSAIFLFSSGKSLAVGQVIGPGPGSSTKPNRKVGLFLLPVGRSACGRPSPFMVGTGTTARVAPTRFDGILL